MKLFSLIWSCFFSRGDNLEIGNLEGIELYLVPAYMKNAKEAASLATSSLHEEKLFLTSGFKTMFSAKLSSMIGQWLDERFIVIYRSDSMKLVRKFSEPKKKSIYIEKTLNEAAVQFGINSNALGYVVDGQKEEAQLCSIFDGDENKMAIPVELFESFGTIRLSQPFSSCFKNLNAGGYSCYR